MTQLLAETPPAKTNRFAPKSEEDWNLGLAILEELVRLNGMQGEQISRECIAEVVGCSPQAVENIEKRVMKKLRRLTSHLRPELEDMGVVQRLSRFSDKESTGTRVRGRKVETSPAPEKKDGLNPHIKARRSDPLFIAVAVGGLSTI